MFSKRKITVICLASLDGAIRRGLQEEGSGAPAAAAARVQRRRRAPPPPPAPAVAQFTAEPSSIQRGQSATLRWEVSGDVTSVSINQGIGTVQSTGSQQVSPTNSTTYTLTATGPGGSVTASATVT